MILIDAARPIIHAAHMTRSAFEIRPLRLRSGRIAVFLQVAAALSISFPIDGNATGMIAASTTFDCPSFGASIALVNPNTGNRLPLLGEDGQGPNCSGVGSGVFPQHVYALGADPSGNLLVADGDGKESRILRIDVTTAASTVVSGCSEAQVGGPACDGPILGSGALGTLLGGLAVFGRPSNSHPVLDRGDILVATSRYEPCNFEGYAILRIDPVSGDRTTVSGLDGDCSTVIGTGDELVEPNGLLLRPDGTLLVTDGDGVSRLVSIDPVTGNRVVLSGCSEVVDTSCVGSIVGSGPVPTFLRDVVPLPGAPDRIAARANFLEYCGSGESGGVMIVELSSGQRSILSGRNQSCVLSGAGPHFRDLEALAVTDDGRLIVSEDGTARILAVDPSSGERRVVSGCSDFIGVDTCSGSILGAGPIPVTHGAVVALPEPAVDLLVYTGMAGLIAGRRRFPRTTAS